MTPRSRTPALVAAVRADLKRWGISADTAMAASALDLAARLAEGGIRPAAASMLHAQLRATLAELVKAATTPQGAPVNADPVDELKQRRDDRRKGA